RWAPGSSWDTAVAVHRLPRGRDGLGCLPVLGQPPAEGDQVLGEPGRGRPDVVAGPAILDPPPRSPSRLGVNPAARSSLSRRATASVATAGCPMAGSLRVQRGNDLAAKPGRTCPTLPLDDAVLHSTGGGGRRLAAGSDRARSRTRRAPTPAGQQFILGVGSW